MQSDIQSQAQDFFPTDSLGGLISTLVDAAIIVAALAALVYLVNGGIQWITSGGDSKKVESAQKHITNAIIGLIIVVASFAIWSLVKTFLGLDQAIPTI